MNFQKLTDYLDHLGEMGVPGCDLILYQDHQPIYRHFAGYSDEEGRVPKRGDETYCLFSCTKLFTTCAAMQLIEAGKLELDAPVSLYLPAYAHLTVREGETLRPARRVMTVRHLMSMQGGLDYDLNAPPILETLAAHPEGATTRQVVDAIARKPLCFEPGESFQYCLCHDVLGGVIEVASGQKFSEYLKAHIFQPLGMETISFEFTPEIRSHLCAQYQFNGQTQKPEPVPRDSLNYRVSPAYESGGAGLISNVRDYALLPDALACGGVGRTGVEILSPEMIRLWSTDQLCPAGRKVFDSWKRLGYSYALGVRTRVDTSVGGRGPLGEFGWDGAAGAWTFVDPKNHLSGFYAQHVRNFGYAFSTLHPTLRNLIYEGMGL